eukprot:gene2726-12599_t
MSLDIVPASESVEIDRDVRLTSELHQLLAAAPDFEQLAACSNGKDVFLRNNPACKNMGEQRPMSSVCSHEAGVQLLAFNKAGPSGRTLLALFDVEFPSLCVCRVEAPAPHVWKAVSWNPKQPNVVAAACKALLVVCSCSPPASLSSEEYAPPAGGAIIASLPPPKNSTSASVHLCWEGGPGADSLLASWGSTVEQIRWKDGCLSAAAKSRTNLTTRTESDTTGTESGTAGTESETTRTESRAKSTTGPESGTTGNEPRTKSTTGIESGPSASGVTTASCSGSGDGGPKAAATNTLKASIPSSDAPQAGIQRFPIITGVPGTLRALASSAQGWMFATADAPLALFAGLGGPPALEESLVDRSGGSGALIDLSEKWKSSGALDLSGMLNLKLDTSLSAAAKSSTVPATWTGSGTLATDAAGPTGTSATDATAKSASDGPSVSGESSTEGMIDLRQKWGREEQQPATSFSLPASSAPAIPKQFMLDKKKGPSAKLFIVSCGNTPGTSHAPCTSHSSQGQMLRPQGQVARSGFQSERDVQLMRPDVLRCVDDLVIVSSSVLAIVQVFKFDQQRGLLPLASLGISPPADSFTKYRIKGMELCHPRSNLNPNSKSGLPPLHLVALMGQVAEPGASFMGFSSAGVGGTKLSPMLLCTFPIPGQHAPSPTATQPLKQADTAASESKISSDLTAKLQSMLDRMEDGLRQHIDLRFDELKQHVDDRLGAAKALLTNHALRLNALEEQVTNLFPPNT